MKRRSLENKRHRDKEPDFSKKGFHLKFPLGPGKTLLTLLCICILCFSLSSDVAWLIGYQYTVYLLYIGVFSTTLMVMFDISELIQYFKARQKEKLAKENGIQSDDSLAEDTVYISDNDHSSAN